MRYFLIPALLIFLSSPTAAQNWNFHDYGYAYEASEKCKKTHRLFEPNRQEELQEDFKRGRSTFNSAIGRRGLEWACGAAMRLYDGTRRLGATILTKTKP